jgi:hypothetical protein
MVRDHAMMVECGIFWFGVEQILDVECKGREREVEEEEKSAMNYKYCGIEQHQV